MIKFIKFIIASLVIATVMALLEIQIEGPSGWASNLPTWKITNFNILGFIGYPDKPITGYHIYLWLYSFLLVHSAFIFNKWSLKKEYYIISFYIFFTTFEGIIWFIINPAYGLSKFLYGEINWYQEPLVFWLPLEYWLRFAVGFVFYKLSINYEKK